MSCSRSRVVVFLSTLSVVTVLFQGSGCGQDPLSESGLEWPELMALDAPSAKLEGHSRKKQADAVRQLLPSVAGFAASVSVDSLPAEARNVETVKVLLEDLSSLVAVSRDPDQLSEAELLDVGAAFHSLVGRLMAEAGIPHVHEGEGPNGGYLFPLALSIGEVVGQLEIKLHDDAGDLEVWLTRGQAGESPLDLPLDTVVQVHFQLMDDRLVEMRVRNRELNEDEDGIGNIRDGGTNYFIFPGDTGVDASWLMGKDFATTITVSIDSGDTTFLAGPFELKPHVH